MCGVANARVNRTPSGLPLCSTCHMELGFCSHRVATTDRTGGSAAVPATAAAGSDTMKMAATRQTREIAALGDYLQHGTKRRRPVALEGALGKGKRREILANPKVREKSSANRQKGRALQLS